MSWRDKAYLPRPGPARLLGEALRSVLAPPGAWGCDLFWEAVPEGPRRAHSAEPPLGCPRWAPQAPPMVVAPDPRRRARGPNGFGKEEPRGAASGAARQGRVK